MTEEQIKQNAEKHADAYATPDLDDSFRVYIYEANKEGYIVGATEATKELQEENKDIQQACENYYNEMRSYKNKVADLEKENTELKDLIENIIRITWGEGWNYSLDWKVKAEQFIKDSEVEK